MTDLYEALDIPRAADTETVRKAYRRKAKATHPDAGGSVDAFALVKLAHDTLTDDARRAHYDETGETTDGGPDQAESTAMQIAFAAVDRVLAEIDRRQLSYSDINVIADAVTGLNRQLADLNKTIKDYEAKILTATRVAKRFRAKDGKVNALEQMMAAKVADMNRALATRRADRAPLIRAIDILKDHTWDMTPEARSAGYNRQADFASLVQMAFSHTTV